MLNSVLIKHTPTKHFSLINEQINYNYKQNAEWEILYPFVAVEKLMIRKHSIHFMRFLKHIADSWFVYIIQAKDTKYAF